MILLGRRPSPAPAVPAEAATWRVPKAGRDRELAWRQPSGLRTTWDLLAGSETLGRLVRSGRFGRRWTFVSGEGEFAMRLPWTGSTEIRRAGEDAPLARFTPNWLGRGDVVLANGTRLRWAAPHWWSGTRELRTEDGEPCVRVRPRSGFLRFEADVELDPRASVLPHLTAILALTWLLTLRLMARRRRG